ncbi:MAG: RnfABCDGE type electron transport complex subunit G [Bacillota bacterium]
MANKLKPKLVIVLTLIMIISAGILTFVQQKTKPIIDQHAKEKQESAILTVLPGAEKYEQESKDGLTLYRGIDNSGNTVGYAMTNSGQGFQSVLKLMIGFDLEQDELLKIKILDQAETPGLGSRISEEEFKSQFAGKDFSDSFTAKEDVDAISGATISSQAIADVIEDAINKLENTDI